MASRKSLILLGIIFVLLIFIPVVVFLIQQRQDIQSDAQRETTADGQCTVPPPVTNVKVDYPNCDGTACSLSQANCTWDAVAADIANYKIIVTEVETSRVVETKTLPKETLKEVFPVQSEKTYKCDVSAVNACGTAGEPGTHSLYCSVGGIFPTATTAPIQPTNPPQSTAVPTQPVVPTALPTALPAQPTRIPTAIPTPRPTMVPGDADTAMIIGGGGLAILLLGTFVLFAFL